ncbi:MAG TPA: type II toxin-antitoxin system HicB family antitoxin [Candidatus Limnocylindrales bacterium]|nr:type II toxin-antitoxin system HicB family antitoxin [Candidatus Limnocylindrales bacterium]
MSSDPVVEFQRAAEAYRSAVEAAKDNYSAWSPDLPGCVATGESLEDVEWQMRAAIAFHLEGLAEDGVEIPEPSGPGVYVERNPRAVA